MTGEFPAQRASNAESVPIWWRHHERIKQAELWIVLGSSYIRVLFQFYLFRSLERWFFIFNRIPRMLWIMSHIIMILHRSKTLAILAICEHSVITWTSLCPSHLLKRKKSMFFRRPLCYDSHRFYPDRFAYLQIFYNHTHRLFPNRSWCNTFWFISEAHFINDFHSYMESRWQFWTVLVPFLVTTSLPIFAQATTAQL